MTARTAFISAGAIAAATLLPLVAFASDGAEGGGLPQIKAEWFPSQLFWLAVSFAVLLLFSARYALPRIGDTLQTRADKIACDMKEAEDISARARDIAAEYERSMARARERAADAVRQVDARIKEKTADMMYAHRTKFTQEIARAEEDLDDARAAIKADMQTIAADTATRAAGMILGATPPADTAQAIVETLYKQEAA